MNFKLLGISLVLGIGNLLAQDVKIEKQEVFVDEKLFLTSEDCKFKFETCPMRNPEGKPLFTVSTEKYTYYNNAANDYKSSAYIFLRFIDFDLEVSFKRTYKSLFELMFKEGLIKEGNISEEDAIKFAKMYGDKIDEVIEIINR